MYNFYDQVIYICENNFSGMNLILLMWHKSAVHSYIHTYIHIYIHTYIHTYSCIRIPYLSFGNLAITCESHVIFCMWIRCDSLVKLEPISCKIGTNITCESHLSYRWITCDINTCESHAILVPILQENHMWFTCCSDMLSFRKGTKILEAFLSLLIKFS